MDSDFVRKRISFLRAEKGVSEYKMSLDLGHSKSYIQSISSGRALPSLTELFYICDYFNITPKEFFDEHIQDPVTIHSLMENATKLEAEDLKMLVELAKRFGSKD